VSKCDVTGGRYRPETLLLIQQKRAEEGGVAKANVAAVAAGNSKFVVDLTAAHHGCQLRVKWLL